MLTSLLVAAVLVTPAPAATPTPGWPRCVERATPAAADIDAVRRTRDGRVVTLTLRSRAMGGEQRVTVVLPRDYDPQRRYPVLYALHGAGGNERTWLTDYHADSAFGDLLVVAPAGSAPDAGGTYRNGGYTDWFGTAAGEPGPAFAWETFHVRELVPYIDRAFRTVRGPAGRAVVGISMGGGGLRYAAKHPGLFGYAGSLSGAVAPPPTSRDCQLGDPALHPILWRGDSAIDLAANLRGVRIFLRTGDGSVGPLDPPGPPDALTEIHGRTEALAAFGQRLLLKALKRAHVTGVDAETYPGTHRAEYWNREIPEFAAWLRRQLARPVRTRRRFHVESVQPRFTAWGWSFGAHRKVRELAVVDVDGRRVRARGSGRLVVTAPDGARTTLDLGPSHTREQRDLDEMSRWRTASQPVADAAGDAALVERSDARSRRKK
jgi:S-formylglutathione hydrolase FrmB